MAPNRTARRGDGTSDPGDRRAAQRTLLVHQGIRLGVLSVELWEPHVVVQVTGIPVDGSAEEREREFRDREFAWLRAYSESPDNPPPRPDHPIGPDHHSLNVRLGDTVSAAYRCVGGGGSGAGWNFTYSYRFEPAVPDVSRPRRSLSRSREARRQARELCSSRNILDRLTQALGSVLRRQ